MVSWLISGIDRLYLSSD